LKSYLNIIIAVILALGAGVSKLYLSENTTLMFYLGIFLILMLLFVFAVIAKAVHNNIKKLREL